MGTAILHVLHMWILYLHCCWNNSVCRTNPEVDRVLLFAEENIVNNGVLHLLVNVQCCPWMYTKGIVHTHIIGVYVCIYLHLVLTCFCASAGVLRGLPLQQHQRLEQEVCLPACQCTVLTMSVNNLAGVKSICTYVANMSTSCLTCLCCSAGGCPEVLPQQQQQRLGQKQWQNSGINLWL